MFGNARVWCFVCVVLLIVALAGCGPGEEKLAAAARAEAWTDLQQRHEALQEKRAKLREMRDQIAAGVEALETSEEGMSPEEQLLRMQEEQTAFEEEIATAAETFQADLVNYINEQPMVQGEEPSEEQSAALRMKSVEDMVLAREYVDKGGDYRRAIDILERAAAIDPGNEELTADIEHYMEMRFVTEERFGEVTKGMTQEEVRQLLGQVFHRNVREYEDQGALAWFYPKEEGGAAAIFFREQGGAWKVYQMDFTAVDQPGADS